MTDLAADAWALPMPGPTPMCVSFEDRSSGMCVSSAAWEFLLNLRSYCRHVLREWRLLVDKFSLIGVAYLFEVPFIGHACC